MHKNLIKKLFIKTFGCQMNEYDSNRLYDSLRKIGYEKTIKQDDADCYILNTCHIRDKAKEKVYHEVGRVKKLYRNKKKPITIVAGCVAQAENEEILKREPYIDMVVGPQSYHKINDILKNFDTNEKVDETDFDTIQKFVYFDKIENTNNKISSFITIQEGCDKFCNFCVVPYTRGPEYSRPLNKILDEAKFLIDSGAREIILLGQNVNAYKSEDNRLSNLILEIEKISGIERIRFTTSHPKDMSDDLIETYKYSKKLMPLIHLPVQSGSNRILNRMNRKHSVEQYIDIFDKLKEINSSIEFSSDFIVGYPGEEDQDFRYTLDLIKKIKFINSYSFIFSPRPGTVAADLELVDPKICSERLKIIQTLLFENQVNKNKFLENKSLNVLAENLTKNKKQVFGRSEYMTPVIFDAKKSDIGKILNIKIKKSNRTTLFGEVNKNYNKKVA
jgi:tRNA-2-methylthio-N6-dimethylallyladenosine synthase